MSGTEALGVDEWLMTTLNVPSVTAGLGVNADGSAPIYQDDLDQGTAFPAVVFTMVAGLDIASPSDRAYVELTYYVQVVDNQARYTRIAPVAAAIDALLQDATGQTADTNIMSVDRQEVIKRPVALEAGQHERWYGGSYRIAAQKR